MVSLARQVANISTGGELPAGVYNSSTGAYIFGPTSGSTLEHFFQSGANTYISVKSASNGVSGILLYNATSQRFGILNVGTAGANTLAIRNSSNADIATSTNAGAWTIGQSGNTGVNLTVNGKAQINPGSSTSYYDDGLEVIRFNGATNQRTIINAHAGASNIIADQAGAYGSFQFIIANTGASAKVIANTSSVTGAWSFGDGTNAATDYVVAVRKTNAINNRLIAGIDAATRGYVRINSAQTNLEFEGASDRRIKTDINDLPDGLSKVMNLRPVSFKMKENLNTQCQGFIAQEFAEVFPSSVTTTDDGAGEDLPEGTPPWTMSDAVLMPYLVKAIQELKQQLDAANDRIAALEGV